MSPTLINHLILLLGNTQNGILETHSVTGFILMIHSFHLLGQESNKGIKKFRVEFGFLQF